jgi:hypothetical protein
MQNPFQQNNAGSMNDPLGFVKKLWGDMQLPGMVTPTLSVDDLDKQIKDLKTVESWLTVNMTMLKGTIQALEVQRATIAALKTMGESFAQATGNGEKAAASTFSSQWPMPEASSSTKTQAKQTVPEPAVEDEMDDVDEEGEEEPEAEALPKAEALAAQKQELGAQTSVAKSDGGAFSNPAAWWTVLQDQFKQALSHAMQDEVSTQTATKAVPGTEKKGSVKTVKEGKTVVSKSKNASAKAVARKAPNKKPASAESTNAKRSEKTTAASKAPVKRRVTTKPKVN